MSQTQFYRECYCSLLAMRPHPVTSLADWRRHILVLEQDRLDELFQGSDSFSPPGEPLESSQSEGGVGHHHQGDESSEAPASPYPVEDPDVYAADQTSSVDLTESEHQSPRRVGHIEDIDPSASPSQQPSSPPENPDPPSPSPVAEGSRENTPSSVLNEGYTDPPSPPTNAIYSEDPPSPPTNAIYSEDPPSPDPKLPDARYSEDAILPLPRRFEAISSEGEMEEGIMDAELTDEDFVLAGDHAIEHCFQTGDEASEGPLEVNTGDGVNTPDGQLHGSEASDIYSQHNAKSIEIAVADNAASYDEELVIQDGNVRTSSDNSNLDEGFHSDRVGQMRRGFADLVDQSVFRDSSEDSSTAISRAQVTSSDDTDTFMYGNTRTSLTDAEILSVAIHDLKLSHRLSREAATDITTLLESFTDTTCWDYRTTRKWIENQTGVKAVSYDCCRKSCMSYAMYPNKEMCDYCQLPRWKETPGTRNVEGRGGGEPSLRRPVAFATYEYIPVIHRLRLWYANPRRAEAIISYRREAESQENYIDYWTSDLFEELKSKGLFGSRTDLGFLLTTDGVQVFKAKTKFSIWPIALQCLNLPPAVRSKRQNLLCAGFIPGPKGPKNLDSFLYPLVKEFEALQNGVAAVLNGSLSNWLPKHDREFVLRGHICLVGADMVAREKIMKVTGNRSYCYCEYCLIQGVWNRGLYCPITPPSDAPPRAQGRKGSGFPWTLWDRQLLPMRTDREFRLVGSQIARQGATNKQRSKYGLKGLSILSQLTSIDFPRSFPPDGMHLWFENVIPDLIKHWRGKYRVEVDRDDSFDADNEASQTDPESSDTSTADDRETQPSKKRRTKGKNSTRHGKRAKTNDQVKRKARTRKTTVKEPKVVATDDEYNMPLFVWEEMSAGIAASAPNIPLLFGPMLRNFLEYLHQMTASEWQLFTFLLAPVYLKDALPDDDYDEFISLVEAIQLSCDYTLTPEDCLEIDQRLLRFSQYYETRYYRAEWGRLKACLPVFHQILHVSQAIRWAGPMYVYSQWAMERLCGTLAGMAKSRVATNRNISNSLSMVEQKNALLYVIEHGTDHGTPESADDEDSDGNIRLANFLMKRLKKARPPDAGITGGIAGPPLNVDNLLFCGPSKVHRLTTYERICLKAFYLNETVNSDSDSLVHNREDADLEADADSFDIPGHCRMYRSASFNTCLRGDFYPFKSTSSIDHRSDQTRSTSFVRFESNQDGKRSHFGEVLFYFTVDRPQVIRDIGAIRMQLREKERGPVREKRHEELLLAFVRHFPVIRDGRLFYRESHCKGVIKVVMASDIHELVGLLSKGKREYITRKHTALF